MSPDELTGERGVGGGLGANHTTARKLGLFINHSILSGISSTGYGVFDEHQRLKNPTPSYQSLHKDLYHSGGLTETSSQGFTQR